MWILPFIALSAVWGGSFAFIKIAIDAGVPPLWVAFWRCFLGALTLWLILLARRERFPRDRRLWAHGVVVALLLNSVPFTLFAFGETRISSVLAGVWNATAPLFTLLFAMSVLDSERPTMRRLLGLALGFAGVLVVLEIWRGVDGDLLLGSLACLTATAFYGAGFTYTRRYLSGRPESGTTISTVQITCAALSLWPAAVLAELGGQVAVLGELGGPMAVLWELDGPAALALLVLGAFGTGLAYILNFAVIRAVGPTMSSTVTYVIPLWSTALGAALLGETIGWGLAAGGLLVIAGVAVGRSALGRLGGGRPPGPLTPRTEATLSPRG